jgi:nitroimidazol reductase NimA-like FMN-containing flavoprotein (pyridoxamine 5'-phosphate oxidase superfamily)
VHEPSEMSYDECRDLLSSGELGRVAVSTPLGPRIIPVNYTVADGSIVFRTTPYSLLGTYARNTNIAFEVDSVEPGSRQGWSVVAVGRANMVEDREQVRVIKTEWDPKPWAGGQRSMYFRMSWLELTGRRLDRAG